MSSSKRPTDPDENAERVSGAPFERVSSPQEAAERKAERDARIEELLHPSPTEAEA